MSIAKSNTGQSQDKFTVKVKTCLIRRGLTVKGLADQMHLARNTVSMAINHPTVLPTVKARILETLKLS